MLLCGPGGDQGGRVEVCTIYRPGRGDWPEVLLDGVGVASPPDMAAVMLDEDARVWPF